MEELMDMLASNESPAEISDKIKEVLFSKATDRINDFRPSVANSMFGEVEEESPEE